RRHVRHPLRDVLLTDHRSVRESTGPRLVPKARPERAAPRVSPGTMDPGDARGVVILAPSGRSPAQLLPYRAQVVGDVGDGRERAAERPLADQGTLPERVEERLVAGAELVAELAPLRLVDGRDLPALRPVPPLPAVHDEIRRRREAEDHVVHVRGDGRAVRPGRLRRLLRAQSVQHPEAARLGAAVGEVAPALLRPLEAFAEDGDELLEGLVGGDGGVFHRLSRGGCGGGCSSWHRGWRGEGRWFSGFVRSRAGEKVAYPTCEGRGEWWRPSSGWRSELRPRS